MQEFTWSISERELSLRLDMAVLQFVQQRGLGLSRTFVQKLIRQGRVFVNGKAFSSPHHKVKSADKINFTLEEKSPTELLPEDIPLEILHEDEDVLVLIKPAGLVVHPAPGNKEHTLVNALLKHCAHLSDINANRPGIVHRLDKETSGVLVAAKNNAAHLHLCKQFAAHSVLRTYLALVRGEVEFDEHVIELPIGRHPYKRKNMAVEFSEKSRYAKTYYRTLKRAGDYSLLELKPFTGRTHQLRVHLAFIGHPILGDSKYGRNNAFSRLALHASYLAFIHPRSGKLMEFSSEMPGEFKEFLKKIK